MKRQIVLFGALLALTACQQVRSRSYESSVVWSPTPAARDLEGSVEYLAALEAMSPRELRLENDRLRKVAADAKEGEHELRWGLLQVVQLQRAKNYQKAAETLEQLPQRARGSPAQRAWLKMYQEQLLTVAQLERELAEEKRQKSDLEMKLKGLSDIEMEMSQRDQKTP